MRALIQRVTTAAVAVEGDEVARITPPPGGHGLLILVGVTHDDDAAKAATLARKVWTMRILEDEKSASEVGAPLLVVSQVHPHGRYPEEPAAGVVGRGAAGGG